MSLKLPPRPPECVPLRPGAPSSPQRDAVDVVLAKLADARSQVVQARNALGLIALGADDDCPPLDAAMAAINTATDLLDEAAELVKEGT